MNIEVVERVLAHRISCFGVCMMYLPRWLSWLRHSAHRPGRSVGGAEVQFPGSTGRFHVWIPGAHALRLISRAGKEGSTASSIICDHWLILS